MRIVAFAVVVFIVSAVTAARGLGPVCERPEIAAPHALAASPASAATMGETESDDDETEREDALEGLGPALPAGEPSCPMCSIVARLIRWTIEPVAPPRAPSLAAIHRPPIHA